MSERAEDAGTLFRLADKARSEARSLRERAAILEREAKRLDAIASAVSDGRSVEGELAWLADPNWCKRP